MIMCDQDPDVVRWGLHLLLGEFSSTAHCETTSLNDTSIYRAEYSHDKDVIMDCANIENDEIIALALQEELSEIAIAEASGMSTVGEEHLQASVLSQDWFRPIVNNSLSGGQEAINDVENSSSSSQGDKLSDGEGCSLELTDDFSSLDGEVGKRLNNIVPISHVPKINGEIPSTDEAISDHERLLERLKLYDLVELKVQGDGNCQFRALSDQFYRAPEHHKFVRQEVVNQLQSHPEIYEGYVPMAYGDYLKRMSKSGEWGDHVTLQAAADSYGVKIFIVTSFRDTCYVEIMPINQKSKRVIFLSFWAEVHYNSIYPEGGKLLNFIF
ncbi:OTU domain-containing protein 5 [Apostasia shenzhenica]|uniref:ubiquitinyl hydrolase 1 n=1 Tax=Apostasia shenzhenica TaxID=1088818 RepID=A0A2H9ZWV6_9ASPA|nr:OTU domain-containing protein 5 [Apostasia shenzhenica]